MPTGFPGDGMGQVVIAFIAIVFIIVIGSIAFGAGKGLSEWSRNNAQPVLAVPAKVVLKRTDVTVRRRHRHHGDGHVHHGTSTSTDYHATFELESGERLEFDISGEQSGLLAEGDTGELTYQGTRFQGFARRLPGGGVQQVGKAPLTEPLPLAGTPCVSCSEPVPLDKERCPSCGWTQPGRSTSS